MQFNDQQALTFVQGQAFKINQRVYEARYPDYDFARLIYVDTSGPEWSPGVRQNSGGRGALSLGLAPSRGLQPARFPGCL